MTRSCVQERWRYVGEATGFTNVHFGSKADLTGPLPAACRHVDDGRTRAEILRQLFHGMHVCEASRVRCPDAIRLRAVEEWGVSDAGSDLVNLL